MTTEAKAIHNFWKMTGSHFLSIRIFLGFFLAGILGLAATAVEAQEEGISEQFRIEERPGGRGNLLNLFFGSPPELPTDRGKLIIQAFRDDNGNNRRDPGERSLHGEIVCTVDEIEYQVPAFIPGLDLSGHYEVSCEGEDYLPMLLEQQIFIERRGQIIRIEVPCQYLGPPEE
ncbi:hypothetical protein GSUB_13720 [Geoalkalibacter subterraneus]|uniref:Uncharacterized protein n=1 Tax=Geoalkalibacter subterraneus TaxID=483547 RepID=A0A0B5FJ72_9BACT|nr:hypothetical protein GSUB_13720 [Geoalkalibacter subterraneus]